MKKKNVKDIPDTGQNELNELDRFIETRKRQNKALKKIAEIKINNQKTSEKQ